MRLVIVILLIAIAQATYPQGGAIKVQPSGTNINLINTAPPMLAFTDFVQQATPIEHFGGNAFYTEDKFYGTITITPYPNGDSSLITYTGSDSPFSAEYLGKEFVAFKAHRTDSFPTTKNWRPGVSSCVYSQVIRVIDGKNVVVNFKYNGNNEDNPQPTYNAFGYFFYDNRMAFDAALAGGRLKPIALQNGKTYVTKGLFGCDYLPSERPIIFIAADSSSPIPANIKFSIEDEWTALSPQLWGGWNDLGASLPQSYINDFGNRRFGIRLRQDIEGGQFTVRFANIRFLPPHYSNTNQQGSRFETYFIVSGSNLNGSFTRQHWGIVDIAGCDTRYERKRYDNINFPDTPSFVLPFGFAYSNGGGKAGTVSYPTGDHTDVVEFMDYRLRANHAKTANATWLTNATLMNLKNKVATAAATIGVGNGVGGYGLAGNKWTIEGIGRDTTLDWTVDTLLADVGVDIAPNTRTNAMRTRARFKEETVNGELRLVMEGSKDSAWTVWSVQTYYDWSSGMVVGNSGMAHCIAKFIAGGDTIYIPMASGGSENQRSKVGLNDSRGHAVRNLRTMLMAHTLPSVNTQSKLYIQTSTYPNRFGIWPHLALKGDTITVNNTGHQYRVVRSRYVHANSTNIQFTQGVQLEPINGAPSLPTNAPDTLDITFNTAKARNYLNQWYDGVVIEYPRQTGGTIWDPTDMIVDGGEMNYGDNEVNHDFANMRKWGNLRYGTEFGDNAVHFNQLWRTPKVQRMKNVFEYISADWYGQIASRSFWRREVITGFRQYYIIDGGWMKGNNGGGTARVKFVNRPRIGGGANNSNIVPQPNAIPQFGHGFTHDGNGVELISDIRVRLPQGDTLDLRNSTFSLGNNGLTVHPYGLNSRIIMDNFTFNGGSEPFAYAQSIILRNLSTSDTSVNAGTPISTGSWVGTITGNNVVGGLGGPADYNNLIINLTNFSPTTGFNRWWITTPPTYPVYCTSVLVNGQNPVPNSSPITYINPCPPQ